MVLHLGNYSTVSLTICFKFSLTQIPFLSFHPLRQVGMVGTVPFMVHVCARTFYMLMVCSLPLQSTYVNFGEANSEKSGSVGRGRHPTARRAGAEAFLNPAPANCAPREVEVRTV